MFKKNIITNQKLNHSTEIKLFQTQKSERLQSSVAPVSRCRPAGGGKMKRFMFARPCAQGRADASLTGHARAL